MNNKMLPPCDQRNYGIDALRLVSIFMVVMLHVLGFGGVLSNSWGAGRLITSLLWVICFCSVNCFAIISGYVGYSDREKPYRYSRYVPLWLQVFFYSFGISLLVFLVNPKLVDARTLLSHAFPVINNHYWYFSSYTILFFLIPWLNKFVRKCSKRTLSLCILGLFLVFSCLGTVLEHFGLGIGLDGGYSFGWLAILYLAGAWMKKCDVPQLVKSRHACLCAAISILATWLGRGLLGISKLVLYISPTIVLLSVAVFILFARMQPGARARKWIACFAPAAFGVYLVHLQQAVGQYCIIGRFVWVAKAPAWLLLPGILACTAGIFALSLLIEKLRIALFKSLKINERSEALCRKISGRIAAALNKRLKSK